MYLIVGLGNPGKEYEQTRHNAGFMVIDAVYKQLSAEGASMPWKTEKRFQAQVTEINYAGEKALLVKPNTFMNLSGQTVTAMMQFYKIPSEKVLIVYDDIDITLGTIRLRQKGSAGTHNGMRSVVELTGKQDIPRLRVGIALPDDLQSSLHPRPIVDFVLGKFSHEEQPFLDQILTKATKAVLCIIEKGFTTAMDRFNG